MEIRKALKIASEHFAAVGIESNILDARLILAHAIGESQEYLISHYQSTLPPNTINHFMSLINRRCRLEPIAYILGEQEFFGRPFSVNKNVLIPRADTENIVEAILNHVSLLAGTNDGVRREEKRKDAAYSAMQNSQQSPSPGNKEVGWPAPERILDLGTGSGAISVTLAAELPTAKIVAVDISPKALALAKSNAERYIGNEHVGYMPADYETNSRLIFLLSDWYAALPAKFEGFFDIIVSNPPYISYLEQDIMAKETLLYEPEIALYAKHEGLASYLQIIAQAAFFLAPQGKIFLEIGFKQHSKVSDLLKAYGFTAQTSIYDLSGHIRGISATSA